MTKEAKTASELEAMIMQKAALRADCAEVMTVAVRGGQMGWRVVTIVRDGRMTTVTAIDEIADELRAKYDLHVTSDDGMIRTRRGHKGGCVTSQPGRNLSIVVPDAHSAWRIAVW